MIKIVFFVSYGYLYIVAVTTQYCSS